MEDMDSRLNALLSDPEAMGRIMALAQQLSGESAASSPPPSPEPPPSSQQEDDGFDPMLLLKFLPLLQELRQDNSSQSMQFLSAMRPFLKPERQEKVERAITLAKIIHLGKKFFTGGTPLV